VKGADYYLDNAFANETVVLIPVGPLDGVCGEIETRYDVAPKNCCDDEFLTEIVYDIENSADIIADGSGGLVLWEGGQAPYEVSVRGQGFFLDRNYTVTDATTNSSSLIIRTEDACGVGSISITDGCSVATGYVRSTEGEWAEVGRGRDLCMEFLNSPGTWFGSSGVGAWYYAESMKYRVEQRIAYTGGSGAGGWLPPGLPCMDSRLCGNWFDGGEESCKYVSFYGLREWTHWGILTPPPMSNVTDNTTCYQNNCQACETSMDKSCDENPYQPDTCVRSSNTRWIGYTEPLLLEWKC